MEEYLLVWCGDACLLNYSYNQNHRSKEMLELFEAASRVPSRLNNRHHFRRFRLDIRVDHPQISVGSLPKLYALQSSTCLAHPLLSARDGAPVGCPLPCTRAAAALNINLRNSLKSIQLSTLSANHLYSCSSNNAVNLPSTDLGNRFRPQ